MGMHAYASQFNYVVHGSQGKTPAEIPDWECQASDPFIWEEIIADRLYLQGGINLKITLKDPLNIGETSWKIFKVDGVWESKQLSPTNSQVGGVTAIVIRKDKLSVYAINSYANIGEYEMTYASDALVALREFIQNLGIQAKIQRDAVINQYD